MALRLHNTLTGTKELFRPLETGRVRIYTCGPTVHDRIHIGNFRTFLFEDVLRRYLGYSGYQVTQVMNITDVEDKIITRPETRGSRSRSTRRPSPRASLKTCARWAPTSPSTTPGPRPTSLRWWP